MSLSERNALPSIGPRFYRDEPEGPVMFIFVIDGGNVVGPRPATKMDSVNHHLAWAEFTREIAPLVPVEEPNRAIYSGVEDPASRPRRARRTD